MKSIIKRAIVNSITTVLYITLIVSFILSLENFSDLENIILIPIAMLTLFVCSAAITAFLVFGKPAMLYIDGKKKEAILLLGYTLALLLLFTIALFISLAIYIILS